MATEPELGSEQGRVRHAVIEVAAFSGAGANTERGRHSAVAKTSAFDLELGCGTSSLDAAV